MEFYHKELASGRWYELTLAEQMANIGSEVHRAISWFRKNDKEYFERAFDRALELFDLTLADNRWKGRRKEIARSREYFCVLMLYTSNIKDVQKEMDLFDKYFLHFGVYARLRQKT